MSRQQVVMLVFLGLGLAACGEPETELVPGDPAAERRAADEAFEEYDFENLSWYQEGRPVEFDGREWIPVGQQLAAPRNSFRRIGEFEGMGIYAVVDDMPPYSTLFIPMIGGLWQAIEPTDTVISPTSP